MSWRTVVITSSAKLDYQMGQLIVRSDETKKVFISEIGTLVVENTAVSMTAVLLNELVQRKVKVVFCDSKRNPSFELSPYYASYDDSSKIRLQIKWTEGQKALFWKEIVSEKIRKQAEILNHFGMKEKSKQLLSYIPSIDPGDATNREGFAAKIYFNSLFGPVFSRTSEDPINAALNYGYTILLSQFNRETAVCGYLTQLGFFHDNIFNHFNLSCDLMEPFRPIIDLYVKNMFPEKFDKEEKHKLLEFINYTVEINGRNEFLPNAVSKYVRSVFNAINENDISKIHFYSFNFDEN